ncbi:MAG: glycosyltransferase 87 family protein [Anaerolineales bacterium]
MSRASFRRPFRNLNAVAWQNLALVALITYYAIWFLVSLLYHGFFVSLASDYLALWSAGHIANQQGFAQAYRLEALRGVQESLVPNPDPENLRFTPIPAPYLPVFLLPALLLAHLSPQASFWLWTLLNLGALIGYFIFYARRSGLFPGVWRPFLFSLCSFPVFSNFFWGQLNVWLVIFIGEFLWNMQQQRPFKAGLWLAGLLLKPQTLILILPLLLFWREWRTLVGFSVVGAGLLALSALLLGGDGIQNFVHLARFWGREGDALAAINPSYMMNWRMVATHLARGVGNWLGWGIAALASLLTLWFALRPLPISPASETLPQVLLRVLVATLLVTWHAHYHMAMILLPSLWIGLGKGHIPFRRLLWWVFLPPLVQFFGMVLSLLGVANLVPYEGSNSLLTGLAMMGTTAAFLFPMQGDIAALKGVDAGLSGSG